MIDPSSWRVLVICHENQSGQLDLRRFRFTTISHLIETDIDERLSRRGRCFLIHVLKAEFCLEFCPLANFWVLPLTDFWTLQFVVFGSWLVFLSQKPELIQSALGMDSPLLFDQIQVGDLWTSPTRTITETDVINFAGMTGDYNPLHVDYEFASRSLYRRPIAHGLLGVSWVAGLASRSPWVSTVAFSSIRDWQFLQPLFFGDTVHVETTCLEKFAAGRKAGKVLWQHRLINQSGQVTQQGIFETLVAKSAPSEHQLRAHLNLSPKRVETSR